MGALLVQTKTGGTATGTSDTVVLTSATPVGNRLIVGVQTAPTITTSSITDSAGNTYTKLATQADSTSELTLWTSLITVAGTLTVTVTFSGSSATSRAISVAEYAGLSTDTGSACVDKSAATSGTSTSAASGSTAATTGNGQIAIGAFGGLGVAAQSFTGTGGFTKQVGVDGGATAAGCWLADAAAAVGTTPSATGTLGQTTTWSAICAVLKIGQAAVAVTRASN
jgi:hypothetical protein